MPGCRQGWRYGRQQEPVGLVVAHHAAGFGVPGERAAEPHATDWPGCSLPWKYGLRSMSATGLLRDATQARKSFMWRRIAGPT